MAWVNIMNDTHTDIRWPAYWSAVFSGLALLHLVLNLQSQRSVLHNTALPLLMRIAVLGTEIMYLAVFVGVLALLRTRLLNPVLARLGMKSARRFPAFLLAWLLITAYLASWGTFEIVGVFADFDALRMFFNDPQQIFQHATHISTPLVLSLLTLSLLLAWALSIWLVERLFRSSARMQQSLLMLGFLIATSAATAVLAPVILERSEAATRVDVDTGVRYSLAELYSEAREETGGPLSRLVTAMFAATLPGKQPAAFNTDKVTWRPIISLDDYSRGIDTNRLDRKNVIVILIESLRADQLSAYRGRPGVMPALDQLAKDSLVFTNAYTQSSHSNYADLGPLSSQYPLRSADIYFYPEHPAYPRVLLHDVLHHFGYRTAIFSSQNEHWGNMLNFLDTGSLDRILHAGNYDVELNQPRVEGGWSKMMIGDKPSGKIDDRVTVAEAIRWLKSEPERPFFIYMNLQNSHFPYEVPKDFQRRFVKNPKRMPVYLGPAKMQLDSEETLKDLYADSLYYIDAQLASLFDYLREASLMDHTLIVVSADTGTAFQEHGMNGNAADLFNEVVKVPLIIHAPGRGSGVIDDMVQHIDVPPSILQLLGLPPHPALQGTRVFSPAHSAEGPVFLVSQTPLTREYAIVRGGWKLVLDVRRGRRYLYNLATDPGEHRDVLGENPGMETDLLQQLQAWIGLQLAYYNDPSLYLHYYPPVITQAKQ